MFQLFRLLGTSEQIEEMAALYRRGGFGYGEIKKAVADAADVYFAEARIRRQALEEQPQRVIEILTKGALKAREKAAAVLARAESACGLRVAPPK